MKDERFNPPYMPYFQGISTKVIFRLLLVSEIPRGFRNSQSCDADFPHVTVHAALHAFHENIYSTCMTTFAEELDIVSSKTH